MSSRDEQDQQSAFESPFNLESPFLDAELFAQESEGEWEARLAALEMESPFQRVAELGIAVPTGAEEMEAIDDEEQWSEVDDYLVEDEWTPADLEGDLPDIDSEDSGNELYELAETDSSGTEEYLPYLQEAETAHHVQPAWHGEDPEVNYPHMSQLQSSFEKHDDFEEEYYELGNDPTLEETELDEEEGDLFQTLVSNVSQNELRKRIDDYFASANAEYVLPDGTRVKALPRFWSNKDFGRRDDPGAKRRRAEAMEKLKGKLPSNFETLYPRAIQDAVYGKPKPSQIAAILQGLIDAGEYATTAALHPGLSSTQLIRKLQEEYQFGIDCAGYVQLAFIYAFIGNDNDRPNVRRRLGFHSRRGYESLSGDTQPFRRHFKKVPFTDAQTGDLFILNPRPSGGSWHTTLVVDHTQAGTVHTFIVDASWGDLYGEDHSGVARRTWVHDTSTGDWWDIHPRDNSEVNRNNVGPYKKHPIRGVFRARQRISRAGEVANASELGGGQGDDDGRSFLYALENTRRSLLSSEAYLSSRGALTDENEEEVEALFLDYALSDVALDAAEELAELAKPSVTTEYEEDGRLEDQIAPTTTHSPKCYEITSSTAVKPSISFEFDLNYGASKVSPPLQPTDSSFADTVYALEGKNITSHRIKQHGFRLEGDGNRIEIATKRFTLDKNGQEEMTRIIKDILTLIKELRRQCMRARQDIGLGYPRDVGSPRYFKPGYLEADVACIFPFSFNRRKRGYFGKGCGVGASPQATFELPLAKVNDLVTIIRRSESEKVAGRALSGPQGYRQGARSVALYDAQRAVNRSRDQFIKTRYRLSNNDIVTAANYSPSLQGLLILMISYLRTSELTYGTGDYEGFAKAYLPLNVKNPFRLLYADLTPEEKRVFAELYDSPRTNFWELAKPGATSADAGRKLFPDIVSRHQTCWFSPIPTWDDFVEKTVRNIPLIRSQSCAGAKKKGEDVGCEILFAPLSRVLPYETGSRRVTVEMRRLGFNWVLSHGYSKDGVAHPGWDAMTKTLFDIALMLNN